MKEIGKRTEIRMNKRPKFEIKENASGAAVPGQIANTPLDSCSKDLKIKPFDISSKQTVQSLESRDQMTPGVVESFNQASNFTANTPCVEEYFISRASSQQKKPLDEPKSEQESLPSSHKKHRKNTNEHKESLNEIESDSSNECDDEDDEDYEEECKDIVPSPEHIPQFYNKNRKQFLEDEAIDSLRKSDEFSNEGIICESEEFVEGMDNSQNQRYPVLFVDVNLGEDKIERLTVYEGDEAADVAKEFCIKNNLNSAMEEKLEQMLCSYLSKIDD